MFVFLPFIFLGIYVFRRKTTKSMIIAGVVLAILLFFFSLVLADDNMDSVKGFAGAFGSLGLGALSFYLAVKSPSAKAVKNPKSVKLSSYEKSTAFQFKAGNKNLIIRNPFRGIFIVGGAGSGKSRTFIYPIIKQSAEQERFQRIT